MPSSECLPKLPEADGEVATSGVELASERTEAAYEMLREYDDERDERGGVRERLPAPLSLLNRLLRPLRPERERRPCELSLKV